MATFAVVENNIVENIAIADDKAIMELLLPEKTLVEETDETGTAWIGAEIIDGKFKPPQPAPSWAWDLEAFTWVPPTPKPEVPAYWDEESLSWIEIVFPEASEVSPEEVTATEAVTDAE